MLVDVFLYPVGTAPIVGNDVWLRDPTTVAAPPAAGIPGGGGGSRLLPRGKPFRERRVVAEVVAVHLMNDLVDRYGLTHGREVYFAMEREAKGPFAPGNKYDMTQRPIQPVELRTPPKRVRVRVTIPPARRS